MNTDLYWLWYAELDKISRRKKHELLEYFTSPYHIYHAREDELMDLLTENELEEWKWKKDLEKIKSLQERIERQNVRYIYYGQDIYPERFYHIPDPPIGFYLKGKLPDVNQPNVAIVGSRQASAYGLEMAQYFAKELAKHQVGIISGLALGIDGEAHRGALKGNGYTLAFIGGGIFTTYPKANMDLYVELEKRGGIISEYSPNARPLGVFFPERNRLISGMADVVLVIEAKNKSGTFITVDQGLEQGKDIYAIPGRITDPNSEGCLKLLTDGARLATSPEDILNGLGISEHQGESCLKKMKLTENSLAYKEKMVYSCLSLDPIHIEEILSRTGLSPSEGISILLTLELNGYIKQMVKNYYIKTIG